MISAKDVLAVVVSYNGVLQTRRAVIALRNQVGHIEIVDNGSEPESLEILNALSREPGVGVTYLGKNRGIGYALNIGVQLARDRGFRWLLTMDQDSVVDPTMIQAYAATVERDPTCVCLTPTIRGDHRSVNGTTRPVRYAITSGNLVRVSLFDEIGLYDEGFFIDCIDFDFCLRLRYAGHKIHRVPNAWMKHRVGEQFSQGEYLKRVYGRHPPSRRYYMSRNFMYLAERHVLHFPWFIVKLGSLQLLLTILVGFFDPKPSQSYTAIARGVVDYLARRTGPYLARA